MSIAADGAAAPLLDPERDPEAVQIIRPGGRSRFLITCEHAGNRVPARLDSLGLPDHELRRHIGWDIGAVEAAMSLAEALDATLIIQVYSRLVVDCNRPLSVDTAMPVVSDGTHVPGNVDLSDAARTAREQEIHRPYHDAIRDHLDRRMRDGQSPALLALHSFTPMLSTQGVARPWDMGLLYNRDHRLATLVDQELSARDHDHHVAHNEPYSVSDHTDYTVPVHGEIRGIHSMLLEIRNDHLEQAHRAAEWGLFVADLLRAVEAPLGPD